MNEIHAHACNAHMRVSCHGMHPLAALSRDVNGFINILEANNDRFFFPVEKANESFMLV